MHDGPVFPGEEHHVSHRADGGQVRIFPQEGRAILRPAQGQHQLEGHPHAGQGLEGIGAVGPAGVHHRLRGGERLFALMVIGDDQVHPKPGGMADLLHSGDAAVHRDDEGDALGMERVDGGAAQAVALFHPVGDIGRHPAPPAAEKMGEQAGGSDAVHVIIPVDRYGLSLRQGAGDPGHRPVHIPHGKGVLQKARIVGQEGPGFFRGIHPPGGEHKSRKGRDARCLQRGPGPGCAGRSLPLMIFHVHPSSPDVLH